MAVHGCRLRHGPHALPADGCQWHNSATKTRAREHLTCCTADERTLPKIMGVIATTLSALGAPPPATTKQMHEWRLLWVEAMCDSVLPLSFFEAAQWLVAIGAVSSGRFTGPGYRCVLASTYVPLVAAKSDMRTAARTREADSSAVSLDGAAVNHQGGKSFVNYSPLALLYATTRLGAVSPTSDNLLSALKSFYSEPIMSAARVAASAAGAEAAAPVPRWRRFLEQRTPAVVRNSPSSMVRMRSSSVSDGTFAFEYGCAAHAESLVVQDTAKLLPFHLALRSSLCATVLVFHRGCPRTLHEDTVARSLQLGRRRVRDLQAYSRTR